MTREEQLDWLCRLRSEIYVYMPEEWLIPMNNALDMTIKALEQEPCEDAISRQAVIGIVRDIKGLARAYVLPEVINQIKSLPPVNPQEPKWIPVGKESPVAFDKVLVTYRLHYDDSIHIGIGNTTNNINGRYYWKIDEQDFNDWDILAWMPLPKPYEPQESEDKE